jgi:hypothetical protein
MGLEFWLIPTLAIVIFAVAAFCVAMKYIGGRGVRGEGRTVLDKPVPEDTRFRSD